MNNVAPESIEYVICTDGQVENIGNLNLFPNAVHIVGYSMVKGDCHLLHDFVNVSTKSM